MDDTGLAFGRGAGHRDMDLDGHGAVCEPGPVDWQRAWPGHGPGCSHRPGSGHGPVSGSSPGPGLSFGCVTGQEGGSKVRHKHKCGHKHVKHHKVPLSSTLPGSVKPGSGSNGGLRHQILCNAKKRIKLFLLRVNA